MKRRELVGERFGRWLVFARHSYATHTQPERWSCRCDCGTIRNVSVHTLLRGTSVSCGCLRVKLLVDRITTHAQTDSPEWFAWQHIIQRCTNPNDPGWDNYGGRGISIFPAWRNDFSAFLAHVGKRPSAKHSIDRIDNDGNYEPGNVRWATAQEQATNTRRNKWLTLNGQTKTQQEWAKHFGISYQSIQKQIKCGSFPSGTIRKKLEGNHDGMA